MLIKLDKLVQQFNLEIRGVLHCGASTGQEAEMYNSLGIQKVIWVEAIPKVYEKLVEHIKVYPQNIAINSCLSDVDGQDVEFNISSNDGESSSFLDFGVHKDIHPDVWFVDKIRLRTSRLDKVLKETDLSSYNFLNLDLQGAELMALKGLGDKLSCFDYCYMEVNKRETYKGCALIEDVDTYLESFGFVRVILADWVGDTWSDALYIKK